MRRHHHRQYQRHGDALASACTASVLYDQPKEGRIIDLLRDSDVYVSQHPLKSSYMIVTSPRQRRMTESDAHGIRAFASDQTFGIQWERSMSGRSAGTRIENAQPNETITNANEPARVPVYLVVEVGALLVVLTCLAAFLTWIVVDIPLISPFASTIGILVSLVFLAMGRSMRRDTCTS